MSSSFRHDVIVRDEQLEQTVTEAKNQCKEIDNTYKSYLNILRNIEKNAIMSGETHQAIEEFVATGEFLEGKYDDVGDCSRVCAEVFLYDLDDTDKYLY